MPAAPGDHGARPPRVLHVMATAEVGGGSEHLVELVRGLQTHGFASLAAFGRDGPAVVRLRESGVEVSVLGTLRFAGPRKLARLFRATAVDLIHLHGSRAGYLGALAARRTGAGPLVYTGHAFSFNRRLPAPLRGLAARAERVTCGMARRVICLNRADRETAARLGIPIGHFVLIPNGIHAARFAGAQPRRAEFGYDPATPVVGMCGRLVPGKAPLAFVAMARRVAAAMPEARFLVVGDGPLRSRFERAVAAAGLAGRVRVTGFRGDVPGLLATFDVAVFPSLWEGLPLAVMEAMAAGRGIVATDVAGHRALLRDGESGRLVPPGDDTALAAGVMGLLGDATLRARLGAAARAHVLAHFTVERMVADTAALYRAVLAGAEP